MASGSQTIAGHEHPIAKAHGEYGRSMRDFVRRTLGPAREVGQKMWLLELKKLEETRTLIFALKRHCSPHREIN